jgi:hypothetical protein
VKLNIDPQSTPAIYALTDPAPTLEIYADEPFDTSDGKSVPAGNVQQRDFLHSVVGSIVDGELHWPQITGIYSTEDSLNNQTATYSAYMRVQGREPIPWLERFSIPPLTRPELSSWSWSFLRIYKNGVRARRDSEVWTKQQVQAAIDATILSLITAAIRTGLTAMVDGVANVIAPEVLVTSRVFAFSMDPGVTGALRIEQADIAEEEGFTIRSTNEGDNGAVVWLMNR